MRLYLQKYWAGFRGQINEWCESFHKQGTVMYINAYYFCNIWKDRCSKFEKDLPVGRLAALILSDLSKFDLDFNII